MADQVITADHPLVSILDLAVYLIAASLTEDFPATEDFQTIEDFQIDGSLIITAMFAAAATHVAAAKKL